MQPAFATAVGAVMLSSTQPIEQQDGKREETTMAALVGASTGSFATSTSGLATTGRFLAPTDALGTPTGTFGMPTAGALFDDPSERLTELAWSQADDSGEEPVLYTGEPYDTDDNRATPSQLMQLPKAEPFDMAPRGTRLPQLFLGLAALVSMIAIGGVAFTLTSSRQPRAHTAEQHYDRAAPAATELAASVAEPGAAASAERSSRRRSSSTPPTSEAPPLPPPPPPPVETYMCPRRRHAGPPPPPPVTTRARTTVTTTVPQPTTTTPQATSSTTPSTTRHRRRRHRSRPAPPRPRR